MSELPETLRASIPAELLGDADDWWRGLAESDRLELDRLCDARREIYLFETIRDAEGNPRVTGGRFLPHDDAFGIQKWGEDYFDDLLGHPELVIVDDPLNRTFHIGCTRHPAAHACWSNAAIPSGFACPFERSNCPMTAILAESTSVRFRRL